MENINLSMVNCAVYHKERGNNGTTSFVCTDYEPDEGVTPHATVTPKKVKVLEARVCVAHCNLKHCKKLRTDI